MAVQFIFGAAGTGKSYNLYKKMTEEAYKNQDRNYIAIVPEQYSMESQKEIVLAHTRHGAFNTEVVSFNRLAYRIFDEMNLDKLEIMDDLGKTMVLRRVLSKCAGNLRIYDKKINMPGFIEKMKSTISELEQYDISEGKLMEMIEVTSKRPSLEKKLSDILVVYTEFNQYAENKRLPQEEILSKLCEYIPESEHIRNSDFFIDGYTGFTPIQKNVVDMLIKYAANVTFAFTLPESEVGFTTFDKHDLFRLSKKTVTDIRNVCRENNIEVLEDVIVPYITDETTGELRSFRLRESAELSHLERNIFRYSDNYIYDKEQSGITVHECENPRKEAEFVASFILDKIQKDGTGSLKYSDFAVITADIELYHRYLSEEFDKYNIPAFIDYKKNIGANRFVDAFSAVLEVLEKDYSYESVMHFLRLNIIETDMTAIDLLDNYIYEKGKKGRKAYCQEWFEELSENEISDTNPEEKDQENNSYEENDFDAEYSEDEETELPGVMSLATNEDDENEKAVRMMIEEVREKLVDCVEGIRNEFADSDCTGKVKALYNFALKYDFEERLELMADEFEKNGDRLMAMEYRQIYEKIIELFDRIVELLGDEKLSRKDFLQVVKDGLSCLKVGIIPATLDCVMVGDVERTRLKDVKKYVIIIGADDSLIPKNTSGSGMISDAEREYLGENSFELAPTSRDNIFIQKYYLYLAMSKPSTGLSIVYSRVGMDGTAKRPAYIVPLLEEMFKKLEISDETDREKDYRNILGKEDAIRYVAKEFLADNQEKTVFNQIYALLKSDEKNSETISNLVDAAFYKRKKEYLDEEVAAKLYNDRNTVSVTKLERYANCPFSQFVQNGLRLGERKKYELAMYELGDLYHDALDLYFKDLRAEFRNSLEKWHNLDDSTREKKIDDAVTKAVGLMKNSILKEDAAGEYIKDRIRKVAYTTSKVLADHIKRGEYIPTEFEYRVKHGKIDRVDLYKNENSIYVKVIDYKSGKKEYRLSDIFYGQSLQLMVYTKDAVEKLQKENPSTNVMAGGAYYFRIDNPVVDKVRAFQKEVQIKKDGAIEESAKQQAAYSCQMEDMKLSGISNADNTNIYAMDSEMKEKRSSDIIRVAFNAKGEVDGKLKQYAVSKEDFDTVLDYAENKADSMSEKILKGDIEVSPVECKYCRFGGICGFDKSLGDSKRELKTLKYEEIMEAMKQFNEERESD